MKSSNPEYKRSQPLLGTYFQIHLVPSSFLRNAAAEADAIITEAFHEAERLENFFSLFSTTSDISRWNTNLENESVEVAPEFLELLEFSLQLWRQSKGAFTPFAPQDDGTLDLNGVAKGYIVDRVVEMIRDRWPEAQGLVNGGGDVRFFNQADRELNLRLGSANEPIGRALHSTRDSVATSSLSVLSQDITSTQYYKELRSPLTPNYSAVVMADSCAIADSLTKVALFADPTVIEACVCAHNAQVLIFDPQGNLTESYGPQ